MAIMYKDENSGILKVIPESEDPIRASGITPEITSTIQKDMGQRYHNISTIALVGIDRPIADIVDNGTQTYTNTIINIPISSETKNIVLNGDEPVYNFNTVTNRETPAIASSEYDLSSPYIIGEIGTPLSEAKTMVFQAKPDTPNNAVSSLVQPDYNNIADISENYSHFNNLDLRYRESKDFVNLLTESGVYFNLFERFNILLSDHFEQMLRLNQSLTLTLQMVIDNYGDLIKTNNYHLVTESLPGLESSIIQIQFLESIRKTLSKNCLNYEQIFNGEKTENELLFFKVEKWFTDTPIGSANQTFLLPANKEHIRFIDTQILRDTQYFYRVTAFYSITNYKYFFSNFVDYVGYSKCNVETYPEITFHKEIFLETTQYNLSRPPMYPHVNFYVKREQTTDDKLQIRLSLQGGKQEAYFIPLNEGEETKVPTNAIMENGMFEFQYREEPASFQVFRIDSMPHSYMDFAGNLIGTFTNENMINSMTVIDSIKYNKKYYYTFRAVNQFGAFSNPSIVYGVTLLKDATSTKLLIEPVIFKTPEPLEDALINKDFKSLLKIGLTEHQLGFILDTIKNADGSISSFKNKTNEIFLGMDEIEGIIEHTVWGRKFKFRVRSNDSGKIVDFNIKVNIVKEKSEEDFTV